MYLLFTSYKKLNSLYLDLVINDLVYLGYTDDVSIAEKYASQFKIPGEKVYYVKTTENFIKGVNSKLAEGSPYSLTEIFLYTSENGKNEIALTDTEIQYMEEVWSECSDHFDDLKYAIDCLKIFTDPKVVKLRKEMKKLFKLLNDCDDDECERVDELYESIDLADRYAFMAERLGLFSYNYKADTN